MKIKFTNGKEMESLGVRGAPEQFQGMFRDCLTFLFDPDVYTIQAVDEAFTPEACETVTLVAQEGETGASEYIHKGYVLRKGLERSYTGPLSPAAQASAEPPKEIIRVTMAQRSYLEQATADLTDAVDMLILSGLEV